MKRIALLLTFLCLLVATPALAVDQLYNLFFVKALQTDAEGDYYQISTRRIPADSVLKLGTYNTSDLIYFVVQNPDLAIAARNVSGYAGDSYTEVVARALSLGTPAAIACAKQVFLIEWTVTGGTATGTFTEWEAASKPNIVRIYPKVRWLGVPVD